MNSYLFEVHNWMNFHLEGEKIMNSLQTCTSRRIDWITSTWEGVIERAILIMFTAHQQLIEFWRNLHSSGYSFCYRATSISNGKTNADRFVSADDPNGWRPIVTRNKELIHQIVLYLLPFYRHNYHVNLNRWGRKSVMKTLKDRLFKIFGWLKSTTESIQKDMAMKKLHWQPLSWSNWKQNTIQ